jgi:hypothetical protein
MLQLLLDTGVLCNTCSYGLIDTYSDCTEPVDNVSALASSKTEWDTTVPYTPLGCGCLVAYMSWRFRVSHACHGNDEFHHIALDHYCYDCRRMANGSLKGVVSRI